MTNEQFDDVSAFANEVAQSGIWLCETPEQSAALRLTALRVAFVALGVTL